MKPKTIIEKIWEQHVVRRRRREAGSYYISIFILFMK